MDGKTPVKIETPQPLAKPISGIPLSLDEPTSSSTTSTLPPPPLDISSANAAAKAAASVFDPGKKMTRRPRGPSLKRTGTGDDGEITYSANKAVKREFILQKAAENDDRNLVFAKLVAGFLQKTYADFIVVSTVEIFVDNGDTDLVKREEITYDFNDTLLAAQQSALSDLMKAIDTSYLEGGEFSDQDKLFEKIINDRFAITPFAEYTALFIANTITTLDTKYRTTRMISVSENKVNGVTIKTFYFLNRWGVLRDDLYERFIE